MKNITKALITSLKKDPYHVLSSLNDNEIATIIQRANYEYYNANDPLFSDQLYDIIKEYLEKRNPKHPILKAVGAAIGVDERKEELPYYLGSLDKIKTDEKVLNKWISSHPGYCVVSDKLDGNSALLHWKGCELKLYSRGDGSVGQNISHLLSFIKNIPSFKGKEEFAVRGELIISRDDFEKVKDKGANARNMVAGLINSKVPDLEVAALTQFVAYELILPKKAPHEQYKMLVDMGYKTAHFEHHETITMDKLSNILVKRREKSEFEVDGIVVTHDKIYKRVRENPSYAFAFKSIHTMQKAEVIVTNVEWNLSKDGYLIPVVNFNDVHLAGVTIKRAHGFNGKFIHDNKIGPGSRIIIMRSGDVIPYITEIISPSETGYPQMPEIAYDWTKTGVDIMINSMDQKDSKELRFKNIEHFFTKVEVKGLGPGNLKKMYDAGFDTVKKIYDASVNDLRTVEGFKDKTANKIHEALQESYKKLDCLTIMDASNTLGRGIGPKKLEIIIKAIPDIITTRHVPSISDMTSIKGIEKTTAEQMIQHLPKFFEFLDSNGLNCVLQEQKTQKTNVMAPLTFVGKKIVFTGFRDAKLEAYIKERGGEISGGVSKNTTLVVKKDTEEDSGKLTKAKDLGVPIINLSDFMKENLIVL